MTLQRLRPKGQNARITASAQRPNLVRYITRILEVVRKYSNSTAKSKYSNLTRNFQSYGSSYCICQGCALHAKNTRLTLTLTFAQLYRYRYIHTRYLVHTYQIPVAYVRVLRWVLNILDHSKLCSYDYSRYTQIPVTQLLQVVLQLCSTAVVLAGRSTGSTAVGTIHSTAVVLLTMNSYWYQQL